MIGFGERGGMGGLFDGFPLMVVALPNSYTLLCKCLLFWMDNVFEEVFVVGIVLRALSDCDTC